MSEKIDELRTEYLNGIRNLTVACFQRASLERTSLCVESLAEPSRDDLERYSRLRVKISTLTQELRQFEEKAGNHIGVLALLNGVEPEIPVRIACCLLLARAISDIGRPRTVAELADYAVGTQSPSDFLSIRQSFCRGSGILRPHVALTIRETSLEEAFVNLHERSVCKMLALPESGAIEFDLISERGRR